VNFVFSGPCHHSRAEPIRLRWSDLLPEVEAMGPWHLVLWLWLQRGESISAFSALETALWTDDPGRLHLLQAASPVPLHAGHAAASLDFSGLATLEYQVEHVHDHRLKGQLLEQAAMKAAALAVAEETAAAKAAGGGAASARFLASARLKHFSRHVPKVSALGRFEVTNESHGGIHAPNATSNSSVKAKEGIPINPFNPFTNPFFNPFTPNPYTPMNSGGGGFKVGNLLLVLILVILAVSFCAITWGGIMEDDDSSGDDSTYGYLNRYDPDAGRRGRVGQAKKLTADERKRGCCSSCFSCLGLKCPTTVVTFVIVAVFFTVLGGKILWSWGILQPLLAQLLLYAYVILIIIGFVAVFTHEVTRKFRTMISGIYQMTADARDVMPGFMKKKGNQSPRF